MFSKALVIFSVISVAFATVYITSPTAQSNISAGVSFSIAWQDDGNKPTLKDFGPARVGVYVGNVNQQVPVQIITDSIDVSKVQTIDFIPKADAGPNSDQYFIRFDSEGLKANGTNDPAQAFSHKFSLNNMTGSFNASVSSIIAGQSTAPFGSQTSSGSSSSSTSSPVLTGSGASKNPTSTSKNPSSTSSTTSATARPSGSGAMGLKAGWAGIVFGAVVGVTMF